LFRRFGGTCCFHIQCELSSRSLVATEGGRKPMYLDPLSHSCMQNMSLGYHVNTLQL